ncbi:MAG: NAD-dependent epimerase [Chryseotalea sp. WA131a]|jgi:UDP-glucuronate 4-epimerase|nr:MAG: NAD-dependent epimerase [Chryseotalea sp. WA131a]
MSKVLVTGVAGFIGYHLAKRLCEDGFWVEGLDNLNDYYDVNLKKSRLDSLRLFENFTFSKVDIANKKEIDKRFENSRYDAVVNLAAQAGVRHSIENPYTYLESNIQGFLNILEASRHHSVKHLIYASSSSVYGANKKMPFSTQDNVDHPLALYAASKKSNELMAHAYSTLYHIPTTGLRFFSAYGPYGRPDMALFIFTKAILAGEPINVYNHGIMKRDFTYIDDLVECVIRLLPKIPSFDKNWDATKSDPATSFAPYRIFNIGNSSTVELIRYIEIIEEKLKKKAIKNFLPMQQGDVPEALADVSDLMKKIDFKPDTPIEVGVGKFIDWYLDYYKEKR